MNIEELKASTRQDAPPAELPRVLAALWWDAKGNFERAHELADDETDGRESAWVHAYLHRKHGEPDNAAYWYRLAHQSPAQTNFEDEWSQIAGALLDHQERK
jgi:hypothetical protein